MTAADTITDEQAHAFFQAVRDYPFAFTSSELPAFLHHLQWTVIDEIPDESAVAVSNWGLTPGHVYITRHGPDVHLFDIDLTQTIKPAEPDAAARLQDAFAHLAVVATEELGPPTLTEPGTSPSIRWRLGDTTFMLVRLSNSVAGVLTSTAYQDREDELARKEAS